MIAYYNEIDPFAAAWLRELIKAGHIAPGEVDERSIEDVYPTDLRGFTQCHFFAGIGVWSYALRQAGWPDDRPVWTGSCPCQPFSTAGKRTGTADERHLWPTLYHLIKSNSPERFFGEQVASKDGLAWFDTVQSDLEGAGYAIAGTDLCAAGFGAPHIRQRLYFVADSNDKRSQGRGVCGNSPNQRTARSSSLASGLADSASLGQPGRWECDRGTPRLQETVRSDSGQQITESLPVGGFWKDAEWIRCLDGRQRPVESGTFPLAHGATNRVGRLRGYGNALVAPVATAFIEAFLETELEQEKV